MGHTVDQDTERDALEQTNRVLRRLLKMQSEGETSGEEFERILRKARKQARANVEILEGTEDPERAPANAA